MALRALQGPTGGGAPVGGTGTTNTIPRWTGPSTLGDSQLKDNGTLVGIGASLTSGNRLVFGGVASGTSFIKANEATFQIGNIFAGPFQILTSDTPQVTVTATGNVGIGTASPGYKLDVAGVINTTDQVRVFSSATSADVRLNAGFGGTVAGLGTVGAHPFMFFTNNAERARIDSTGRWYVGVGAVSPGSSGIWAIINQPGGAGGQEWHNSTGSQGGAAIVPSQDRATWYVYSGAVGSEVYKQSCAFTPTGIDLTGASATPGLKLPATPGNADTQTLDCYEENTWTPTRAGFGGTNPTVTASYTRVGRLVTITVRIVATGGAPYSGTSPTTNLSMPATITPAANTTASSLMVYGDTTTVGTVTAWNDGLIYLPTFALTTQQTAFSITYRV